MVGRPATQATTDSNGRSARSQTSSRVSRGFPQKFDQLVLEPLVGGEGLEKGPEHRPRSAQMAERQVRRHPLQVVADADVGHPQAPDRTALRGRPLLGSRESVGTTTL